MSRVDWTELAARLQGAGTIVLGTHINADGDGLGCEIALNHLLAGMGRSSRIVNSEPASEKYRFLDGADKVEAYEAARHSDLIRNADLFIVLDNSSVERLSKVRTDVEATRALKVCIDHMRR